MKTPSFRNDTFFYGVAVMAERVISFLILPLLTKTLPQEYYGVWTQIVVTASLMSGFVLLGFHTAAVRFLAGRKESGEISGAFHRMLFIVIFNSLLVAAICFFFAPPISGLMFGSREFSAYVRIFGLYVAVEAVFELQVAFLRARGRIRLLSVYYVLKNLIRMGALAAGILVFRTGLFQAVSSIIALQAALIAYVYVFDIYRDVGVGLKDRAFGLKEVMLFSLPLVPYGVLIWVNNFVNRYFILHVLDMRQLSVYAVAYSLAAIVAVAYSVLGFTLYPHMAKLWNTGDRVGASRILGKALSYYLFFAAPFIAVITALNAPLVRLLSTAEYVAGGEVVFFLSVGIVVFGLYQLFFYAALLLGKTALNLIIAAVSLLSNVVLNIALVPALGIAGAALSVVFSNLVLALWTYLSCRGGLDIELPWRAALRAAFGAAAMGAFLAAAARLVDLNSFLALFFVLSAACAIYIAFDLFGKNSLLSGLRGHR